MNGDNLILFAPKTGYEALACAVILQAAEDIRMNISPKNSKACRDDAKDFVSTNRLEKFIYANHLNLNPEYIRRGILKNYKERE
jgi:hypothetical protein